MLRQLTDISRHLPQRIQSVISNKTTGAGHNSLPQRPKFIREAIKNMLWQSYDKWKLLLIDDGSTDDSDQSRGKVC